MYKRPKLVKTATKLKAYNGTPISVVGKCFVEVRHKGEVLQIPFIVADTQAAPILGLQTSSRFQLIKRIESVTRSMPNYTNGFNDCFGELGKLPKVHHITMKNNAVPMIHPPRRIPIAIQDKVKHELNRMVKLKVIEKIAEPTDWVSSMVTVQKPNGSLRICLDPKDLNLAIKREHFPMATADEIFSQMADAKLFTKLDASNAFWQIEVDEESSKLLTFNTPQGRYCFKRLPFDIHSASEICQQQIRNIIEGIPGCVNAQDDIIIWGVSPEQLKARTIRALEEIRKSGLKLNKSKCQYEMNEVSFLGYKLTSIQFNSIQSFLNIT